MHTEKREDPLVELGYEIRDVNTKALTNGVVGFFIFTIASCIVGFFIFRALYPDGFEDKKVRNRIIPQSPYPMVQSNIATKTDIMDLRKEEEKVLTQPIGWIDAGKTKLHLPIDRAMDVIVEKAAAGTTSVSAAPAAVVNKSTVSTKPVTLTPATPAKKK
jgi:hypothetical protein